MRILTCRPLCRPSVRRCGSASPSVSTAWMRHSAGRGWGGVGDGQATKTRKAWGQSGAVGTAGAMERPVSAVASWLGERRNPHDWTVRFLLSHL
uniref:Uncharacterized protein n=1 Tax=mine drainage metagenome TaxID=410659 RepID=E6PJD9_9ZZZZ